MYTAQRMNCKVTEVYNTTVKKNVGGHGRASKQEVAKGVLKFFKKKEHAHTIIQEFIKTESWNILDAFAIANAGLQNEKKKKSK